MTKPEGAGNAGFDLAVAPARRFNNWLLAGGAGLAVVVAGWLFWPRKQ